MGQYFLPVILDDRNAVVKAMHPHDYGAGPAITEHAWCDNQFVAAFEILLALDGPQRVVWAGDYADPDPGQQVNLYYRAHPRHLVRFDVAALGDPTHPDEDQHGQPNAQAPLHVSTQSHPYLLNHDRLAYIDKRALPTITGRGAPHPLPWLTGEGLALRPTPLTPYGTWARQHITVSATEPTGWAPLRVDFR